ncbi:hypothetical protein Tco_0492931 [Tanacetum coccineum]
MSASSNVRRRRVIPTHCECQKPLVRRVSSCRRFLNYRNSNIPSVMRCNAFYWIDPEVPNPWYKSQLFELFLTLNPEERQQYQGHLTAEMRVASLEQELQNA